MKRVVVPEWLDSDAGTPAEIAGALADLLRIHRWLGGVSTTEALVCRVAERTRIREFSLLDAASGSGELNALVARRLARRGIRMHYTLLDRAASHLNGAGNAVVGDALAMPFPDGAFDLVTSALFVHHLDPPDVLRFANESLRVARKAVLLHDIRRARTHLMAAYAGRPLFRSRITRHDATASVRRAYTAPELCSILERSRASDAEFLTHPFFRMGAVLWK
ncbi:MAG: methyltransferase domain-containing protein [Acidobacteria bacterium]|nr:methyltransferase domain-containing protein [Acidobacteriota bacterium]